MLPFSTRAAYDLTFRDDSQDIHSIPIWSSRVPTRVKIFAWLLFQGRLNCKINLLHKHIVSDAVCPRCGFDGEDTSHIFLNCPLAQRIWLRLGFTPSGGIEDLWACPTPAATDHRVWNLVLLITLWKIWDSWNAMTFRQQDHYSITTLTNIVQDLMLWTHRMRKPEEKQAASSWRSYLSSRLHVPM
ncbi:hypothetical protein VPH35_043007 [Triticum aestivum]|uniref:Reverse transcriptase zinc-binding domain-containing protein n=1 Tax=Triticum turgidum subsp. durum TaxID=4567 RepID=A0A9R0RD41_TRITD|nr:unnamed protein product [Triticum turgidum subsp. durum]